MNFSGLSNSDVFNLALQRTEALVTVPIRGGVSPSYVAWHKLGLDFPLAIEVVLRREKIIRSCKVKILQEVSKIADALRENKPLRLADIGPGLGLHDAALTQQLDIREILLIDIEESVTRHHGFAVEGAGYNSLAAAKAFIEAQATGAIIETLNPKGERIEAFYGKRYDVIMSLLSCGFHYPADGYLEFYRNCLDPHKGVLILDLRRGVDHGKLLREFDVHATIDRGKKHDRVMLGFKQTR